MEYPADDDAVRFVAEMVRPKDEAERGGPPPAGPPPDPEPVYREVPFEQWAPGACAAVGADRVREALADRLDGLFENCGVAQSGGPSGPVVTVRYHGRDSVEEADADGTAREYEELLAVTPESVTVTISLEGRRHRETVPVEVDRDVGHPL